MSRAPQAPTGAEGPAAVPHPTTTGFTLGLRALMELGIVVALASWGIHTGTATTMKILLGIGAPLVGFGIWGTVDFHQAGRWSEPLRLVEELVISGLAAWAWYTAGPQVLGWALGLVSVAYHMLVYLQGARLLKH